VSPETPRYGGTLSYRLAADPVNFDSGINRQGGALNGLVYQQYMTYDWTRSLAAGGPTNFAPGPNSLDDLLAPQLAESWQMPEQGVWILKIRQGVHWQKPNSDAGRLMNGREMTTDDVVSSIKRLFGTGQSWMHLSQPAAMNAMTVEKTGPWEVSIKTPVDYLTSFYWVIQGGGYNRVYPPEVVAKYGDLGNWRNALGTGPYMLTDYVPASQLLYTRNPDYWEKDPIGPGKGNQLPYVDTMRELIIPDLSTASAALRSGKLDFMFGLTLDDGRRELKTNPKLEYLTYLIDTPTGFAMRQDKPNLPFNNIKVRQALMMATDLEAIKKSYYGGEAEIDVYPVNKNFTGSGYVPLSQMPESVQALYRYDPEKAKQLLKEAGYPTGFKATVIVQSAGSNVDEVAIYKDMWAKVGIELVLDVKETSIFTALNASRNFDNMIYRGISIGMPVIFYFSPIRGTSVNNPSFIDDPPGTDQVVETAFQEMNKNVLKNMPEFFRTFERLKPHLLEQAYVIPRPTPYSYSFWWPWVKNYKGQWSGFGYQRYHWIDQDLKKSMGY